MATKIEWTNETWNPVVGCTKVSAGCENCYAERMAWRMKHMPATAQDYDQVVHDGQWTGIVHWMPERLEQPMRWRKPRMVFVCSMGDLFHEAVPTQFIDQVLSVMALCPQHTFQVLTKRPERMRDYLVGVETQPQHSERSITLWDAWSAIHGSSSNWRPPWPLLPNVWLGVTVEDGNYLHRLDALEECPAAKKFVSLEPLLGPITAFPWEDIVDWVIVGAETGPGARPMQIEWALDIQDECKQAGVPFFFKQGSKGQTIPPELMEREWPVKAAGDDD